MTWRATAPASPSRQRPTTPGVIDEFVDALVHDREPEVSGKEALTTMRTIFGSIRSSDIARPVAVNTDFVTHI